MIEREKMLAEKWYNVNLDQDLINERAWVKDTCFESGHTKPSDKNKRKELIGELFQTTIDNVGISTPFDIDYGRNARLGKNVYVNTNRYFMDGGQITTGDNAFIGPSCGSYTAIYPLSSHRKNEGLERAEPINIGNNTWFGGHVAALPGVAIGEDSTIGADSVVTEDIPSHSLVVGNPCKAVRKIDNEVPSEALNGETLS